MRRAEEVAGSQLAAEYSHRFSRSPLFPPFPLPLVLSSPPYLPLRSLGFQESLPAIMSADKGRPLPKFGEWDVNNPASAEGFTVIFNKARDERKTNIHPGALPARPPNNIESFKPEDSYGFPRKNGKWFCCG
ncbi:RPM1-interacting protein 4 [Apostasia shenzhenica]|uniref:RPM1-interacting protein 4 n=1 Tax=Apostasia shenzhenica TaxID=1088818 RepID=A0A2I0B860_9ASPA|nr:RPM1-interacting protein 4 [Apostasia shenzhenica]